MCFVVLTHSAMTSYNGMLPCFFGGDEAALSRRKSMRGDEARARFTRRDDVVDVAAGRGVIGLAEFLAEFGFEARAFGCDITCELLRVPCHAEC